jgi:hypothetical protein
MLIDSTVLTKEKKLQVEDKVGLPFSIWDSLKLKGIGSTKLNISAYSSGFKSILEQNNDINYCNIELRPKGIIIHLNKRATRYSWVVPYYQLSLFYSDDFSFHSNGQFLRIQKDALSKKSRPFINKIIQQKAQILKI